jgi:hypothetical protein
MHPIDMTDRPNLNKKSEILRHRIVLGVLLFNAVSAVGGGLALMVGLIPDQPSWTEQTDFDSLYFPGVILMSLVGGSAFVAAVAMFKRAPGQQMACIASGIIMITWIIGEIASIRGFHFLQIIYLATGAVIIWLTSDRAERTPRFDVPN